MGDNMNDSGEASEESIGFTDWLRAAAKDCTHRAAMEALNNGRCIVIMEDCDIVRVYPNGHKEIIKTISDAYVKGN